MKRDGTEVKHSQTIKHWAGNVPRVDKQGEVINKLKPGYKEFDYDSGHYVGQVDKDGLPSGEGRLTWPTSQYDPGPWFKGRS